MRDGRKAREEFRAKLREGYVAEPWPGIKVQLLAQATDSWSIFFNDEEIAEQIWSLEDAIERAEQTALEVALARGLAPVVETPRLFPAPTPAPLLTATEARALASPPVAERTIESILEFVRERAEDGGTLAGFCKDGKAGRATEATFEKLRDLGYQVAVRETTFEVTW
jgi:hypothetical protein